MDPGSRDLLIGLLILLVGAVAIWWVIIGRRRANSERAEHIQTLTQEAQAFFSRIERTGKLTGPATRLLLSEGERALLEEPSSLYESRAYRLYGGGGTRVGRFYVGGGVSESQQRLKQIDEGTVTLTNRRIVFDGGMENRTIELRKRSLGFPLGGCH